MIRVLHFISKMDRAGQETFIMNVYRAADKTEFHFLFLCSVHEDGDYDDEIRSYGGEIYYLPELKNKSGIKKYLEQIHVISNWLTIHRDKFDIVHLHTYHALDVLVHLEACRRAGINRIFIHSHNSYGQHPTIHKICRNIFPLYKFTKIACSKEAARWMYGNRDVKKNNVSIILNGIDTKAFSFSKSLRGKKRRELGVHDRRVLGHIGRFNLQKNHKFLIDVFERYHEIDKTAILVLIGKGELENEVYEYVKEKKLSSDVLFLGTRTDINELLCAMDLFLFPSLYEGLGIVLWEAQCNGLSVISSDIIPQEAIISDGIHLLSTKDEKKWVEGITRYIGIRNERINMDEIDFNETSKQLLNMYRASAL